MRYFSVFLKKNYSISKNIRNFAPPKPYNGIVICVI